MDNIETSSHIWQTGRNKKIKVCDMTTLHIENTIKCWIGKGNVVIDDDYLGGRKKWLKIFHLELIKRQNEKHTK